MTVTGANHPQKPGRWPAGLYPATTVGPSLGGARVPALDLRLVETRPFEWFGGARSVPRAGAGLRRGGFPPWRPWPRGLAPRGGRLRRGRPWPAGLGGLSRPLCSSGGPTHRSLMIWVGCISLAYNKMSVPGSQSYSKNGSLDGQGRAGFPLNENYFPGEGLCGCTNEPHLFTSLCPTPRSEW